MSLKSTVTRTAVKALERVNQNSPTILTTVGVVGGVVSTVFTAKATLKLPAITNDFRANKIEVRANAENKRQLGKDMTVVHASYGKQLVRLYGVPVGIGIVSIACVLQAHNILSRREATAVAALGLVETAFGEYRERVREEFGPEKERELRFGKSTREKGKDAAGNDAVSTEFENEELLKKDLYSAWFDKDNVNWSPHPDYNLVFLRANERWANDRLYARGHLFLNEVFEQLGLPHTQAGAMTGWIVSSGPDGDNKVEFGLDHDDLGIRQYREGAETRILLDFNVDGEIVSKIRRS